MDKKRKIIVGIIVGIIIISITIAAIIYSKSKTKNNASENEQIVENNKSSVIIKEGNIENENLIDEFINIVKMESINTTTLSILEYDELNNYKETKIEYIPGNLAKRKRQGDTNSVIISNSDDKHAEEEKAEYGYYRLTKDNEISEFPLDMYSIKRYSNEEQVKLYFYTSAEVIYFQDICSYNLKNSNYKSKFKLTYSQRKDLGLDKIFQDTIGAYNYEGDINVYTFGGDVSITVENDMVYDLKTALETKVIKINDIIEQAKMDNEYGVCSDIGIYDDGGSIEYYYNDYTILKYNTLDGNKDVVIGFKGSIINQVNDIEMTKKE